MALTKGKIAAALLLLTLMLGLAYPGFVPSDIGTLFGNSKPLECNSEPSALTWVLLAWLALMIGIMFNAGSTVLGGVLGGQKYTQFLKGGLWGLVETAAILAIFSGAFVGLHDAGVANLDSARAYSTVIRNTVIFDFTIMMAGSTALSFISRQSPNIRTAAFRAFPLGFQFAPMFRPMFDGLGTLVQMLAAAVAEWVAHEFIFCMIKTAFLSTLLPIGIFLRAYGLKAAGNSLIGLAIALYFIYPLLMIQVGEMLNNYFTRANEPMDIHTWPLCGGNAPICCLSVLTNVVPTDPATTYIKNGPLADDPAHLEQRLSASAVVKGDIMLSIDGLTPAIGHGTFCTYNTGISRAYGHMMEGIGVLGFWTLPVGAAGVAVANMAILKWANLSWVSLSLAPVMEAFLLYSMYDIVFFVFVVSIVLPLMMIFITITMAKEIAKALGTEIDLSALEKLI